MNAFPRSEKPHLLIITIALFIWLIDIAIVSIIPNSILFTKLFTSFELLLLSQFAASIFLICILTITKSWRLFGFVKIQGWMWLAWSAPFWLYALSSIFAPQATGTQTLTQLATLVSLAFLVGFSEETIYRGGLWTILQPLGIWPTVLITSLLFGAVHFVSLFWGAPWIVAGSRSFFAFSAGLIFAAARLRSGSILAPLILHAVFDAIAFIIFGTAIFDTSEEIDDQSLLYAMIGFAIVPGVIFSLWGAFAVERIRRLYR